MELSKIAAELQQVTASLPPARFEDPQQVHLMRAGLAQMPDIPVPEGVTRQYAPIAGAIGAHIFTPSTPVPRAALLWIHGGGMLVGEAKQDHGRVGEVCARLGITVVSVDYRLAPEYPYPIPLDDCAAVWHWLLSSACALGVDPARIAIGGQSAGSGLAAGLALRLRDEGGVQPAAQWLFCPMLDDRTAADLALDAVEHFLWDNRANRAGWTAYIGNPGADDVPPYAAPARADDLQDLPPTWIGTGTAELFYREDVAYAKALQSAGNAVVLDEVLGAPHGFEAIASNSPLGRDYLDRASSWLARALS